MDTSTSTPRTLKEYKRTIDITDESEARLLISRLKASMWLVFLGSIIALIIDEGVYGDAVTISPSIDIIAAIFALLVVLGFVYLVILTWRGLTAVRAPKVSIIWLFLFSPLGWPGLYYQIANPLRIYLGELPVPSQEDEQKKQERIRRKSRRYWMTFAFVIGVTLLLVTGSLILTALNM
tara:strand:+ start:391 stop:927 length:537 start_codon:yes stop_codon:yes gene_type:complete